MSSSTTSSLIANRKGVLFKVRLSFLLSPTMTVRRLGPASSHTAQLEVCRTALHVAALQIPTIQSVKICYVTGHSAGVRAKPRGADPVALGKPIPRRAGTTTTHFLGACRWTTVALWPHSGEARTQGRVLPHSAAAPAQMKERDAVVQMGRQASLLGSL